MNYRGVLFDWNGTIFFDSDKHKKAWQLFLPEKIGREFYGYATHEQYFYPDYYAYQPEYPAKILRYAELVQKNGYEFFFIEEMLEILIGAIIEEEENDGTN